jgi:hypothetical protein
MKEVQAAVRALRSKAQTFLQLAVALEKLDRFQREFPPNSQPRKHRISAKGRAHIRAAQKARWAKCRKDKKH